MDGWMDGWIDRFVNCNWVATPVAAVQYALTYKQYTELHN